MFEYASTEEKPQYDKMGDLKMGGNNDMMFQPIVMAPDTIRLTMGAQNQA